MALEMILPSGTVPFQTSTSHEYPSSFPPAPPVVNPTLVDRRNDFHVHAHWHTQGGIFALMNPAFKWKGEAIFEQMGKEEVSFDPFVATVPFIPTAANQHYDLTIDVKPNEVPSGIYRVILKLCLDIGGKSTPVCGFDDLGLIEFYDGM